ncbi:MAG: hypothetical protein M3Y74_09830 [Chloroflexota bacterium]|nr:hypothetical protein [Chloroflexota bacterium]
MAADLRVETKVLPGGKIEIVEPSLMAGESVEVIVVRQAPPLARRSAIDILAQAPGHLLFKTAEDVDTYLQGERDSWDR